MIAVLYSRKEKKEEKKWHRWHRIWVPTLVVPSVGTCDRKTRILMYMFVFWGGYSHAGNQSSVCDMGHSVTDATVAHVLGCSLIYSYTCIYDCVFGICAYLDFYRMRHDASTSLHLWPNPDAVPTSRQSEMATVGTAPPRGERQEHDCIFCVHARYPTCIWCGKIWQCHTSARWQ